MRLTKRAYVLTAIVALSFAFFAALFAATAPVLNGRMVVGIVGWARGGAVFFHCIQRANGR